MERNFKTYKLIFLFSIVLFSCGSEKNYNIKKSLDTVEVVPEWLKLNVDEALPSDSVSIWIPTNDFQTSSLISVPRFPRKFSKKEIEDNPALNDFIINPIQVGRILELKSVRNEQVSAQLALGAKQNLNNVKVELKELLNANGEVLDGNNIQIRYVKYVPVERSRSEYQWSPKLEEIIGESVSGNLNPNIVGDPLVSMDAVDIPAYRAQPIWFTIKVPKNTTPGIYTGIVTISGDEFAKKTYKLQLEVSDQKIPDPIDYKFHLDLWVNPTAIADYYKLEHWSEAHWKLITKYLEEYASRGGKNITTTITDEPWCKPWIGGKIRPQTAYGYRSMVQWSKNKAGDWEFDFSIFNRYVATATKAGITHAIHAFSMTPFETNQSILYLDKNDNKEKTEILTIGSPEYERAWSSFLVNFRKNLISNGLFERTYLAFDERPADIMKIMYGIIKNAAPEFLNKIVVAGHPEVGEKAENLSISYMFFPGQSLAEKAVVPVLPTIEDRKTHNKITTFYLCAEPAHPNTLTYSPAIEAQLIPWLALKYNTDGYLRWAFNNWTEDPFNKPVFIHAQGDDYQIYPGKNGPMSSIRWELLKEGIEDYELLRGVKETKNISDEKLREAIELATRSQDGRHKKVNDMLRARQLIFKN